MSHPVTRNESAAPGAAKTVRPTGTPSWTYEIRLHRSEGGPAVGREPVTAADLAEVKADAWFAAVLRRGRHHAALEETPMRILPRMDEDGACRGLLVEILNSGTARAIHPVNLAALAEVARRGTDRLRSGKVLDASEACRYSLAATRTTRPGAGPRVSALKIRARFDGPGLQILPVRPLLEEAGLEGRRENGWYPVFYTEAAYAALGRLARAGARRDPPAETGAALFGPLCGCPDTGEVFSVVCEAVPLEAAEEDRYRLAWTGASWRRIQETLRKRRETPGREAWRLLGQGHGHNFLPGDGESFCEACATRAVCTRSSVFVSDDDARWDRAVFHRQPWHLCHIFGLSARGEPVDRLFGRREGALHPRPFHRIPEFPPTEAS